MNDCITTREKFYHDLPQGELLFRTDEQTSVERFAGVMIVKVHAGKKNNWSKLADFLQSEVDSVLNWGLDQSQIHYFWKDIEATERDTIYSLNTGGELKDAPGLYSYFYDENNWVMYENDDSYLLLYELPEVRDGVTCDDTSAFCFYLQDEVVGILSFLQGWFNRVNGIINK